MDKDKIIKNVQSKIKSIQSNIKNIDKDKIKSYYDKLKELSTKIKFDFNIKVQLFIGFLIPIIFLIIVGVQARSKAEDGMISNYEDSAASTINKQMEYLDFGLSLIRSDVVQVKLDTELQSYFGGTYRNDAGKSASIKNKINSNFVVKAGLNKFINNLYIIPKSEFEIISTTKIMTNGTSNQKGFYEDWANTEEGKGIISSQVTGWIGEHPELDSKTTYNPDEYLMSFVTALPNKSAVVVVDINKEEIANTLSSLDLTEGAMVAFITSDGREVLCKEDDNKVDIIVSEQDFYKNIKESEELSGVEYVKYDREEYLFVYKKSEETGATLVYLIPKAKVIGVASEIKRTTTRLAVTAVLITFAVAMVISLNIANNMDSIIKRLKKVAEGDLTVQMKTKGLSEFASLNKNIMEVINNTRNLIVDVGRTISIVDESANEVDSISSQVDQSSVDIMTALTEIDAGVNQQAEDSQSCLIEMDTLSQAIESINTDIKETEDNTKVTKDIITESIKTMETLLGQTKDSIDITRHVNNDINKLSEESGEISKFVAIIADIAEQTNLLSLNASIEAARAGEAGRGFAVVAEEIRKLAGGSHDAAKEINIVVDKITKRMNETSKTAVKASQIINEQAATVNNTKVKLQEISSSTDSILESVKDTRVKSKDIEKGRIGTLEAISSISAVSEETAASSSNVFAIAESQKETVSNLTKASDSLKVNTEELKKAISVFKTSEEQEG